MEEIFRSARSSYFLKFPTYLLLPLCLILFLSSCHSSRERPFGVARLGKIGLFLSDETYVEDKDLLVRKDSYGFSVMSTRCTFDQSKLVRTVPGEKAVFYSSENGSRYDYRGRVLSGPATKNLPYYKLYIGAGAHGGPIDTLYATVGESKPDNWRLVIPKKYLP